MVKITDTNRDNLILITFDRVLDLAHSHARLLEKFNKFMETVHDLTCPATKKKTDYKGDPVD